MYFENKMNNEFTNCTREKKLIERKEPDDYPYSVSCKNCKFKEGKNNG